MKDKAKTAIDLAAAFQAAPGHQPDQAEHNGPKQGTKKTMKRPVGLPTMKRLAAAPGPCHFQLQAGRVRETWRARVGTTSKGFTYGLGKEYPSDSKAHEAARAYLGKSIAKMGHKAKLPRDVPSIML